MLKCHHHFLGKTDIITLIRDFLAVEPGGHGEFVVVYSESVVAVQVTVEAEQESAGERPWHNVCGFVPHIWKGSAYRHW